MANIPFNHLSSGGGWQQPPSGPGWQQPPGGPGWQQQPGGYSQPQPPPPPVGGPVGRPRGRVLSIIAFVFAGVAIILLPIPLGLAGLILGIVATTMGDPLGKWAIVASVLGGTAGVILFLVVS